jgi:charged multivesicular body protein 4
VTTEALRRKKVFETELEQLAGTRLQLEMQLNDIEWALNAEIVSAQRQGA